MKRIIGLSLGCLLGGCETAPDNGQQSMLMLQNPMVQEKIFRQDTAPLPWVHVLPSERAAHFLDADFDYIARRIRHAMTINPARFRDVQLVLVDYAILEPKSLTTKPMKKKYKGQKYCKEYIAKPERYFMRLSFYRHNQQPPATPLFVGAAVLSVRHAAPFEAMHFLVDDIIDEHLKLPYSQVEVNLDAAEDIEKNLQELATNTTPKTPKVSSKHETSELSHKAHSSTKKTSTVTSTSSSTVAPTTPSETPPSSTTPSPAQGTSTAAPTTSPETPPSSTTPSPSQGTSTAAPTTSPETPPSTTPSPAQGTSTAAPTTSPETPPSTTPSPAQGTSTAAPTASPETPPSSTTPSPSQGTSTAAPTTSPETPPPSSTPPLPSQGTSTAAPTSSSTTTPSP